MYKNVFIIADARLRRLIPGDDRKIVVRHRIHGTDINILAGVFFLLVMIQDNFIYFPSQTVAATPASAGLKFEDVGLTTSDGETIAGWYVPAVKETATLLYLHGNGGNIGDRVPLVSGMHRAGLSVLILDYRGYGESTGRPDEKGLVEDALAGWNYLVDQRGLATEGIVV